MAIQTSLLILQHGTLIQFRKEKESQLDGKKTLTASNPSDKQPYLQSDSELDVTERRQQRKIQ